MKVLTPAQIDAIEWNDMMKGIRFCGAVRGLKVIETEELDKNGNRTGNYKYCWVQ